MEEVTGYSRLQITLHWLIAGLVLVEYMTADFVEHDGQSALAWLHVWPGVAILGLMALRLLVRFVQGAPEPPASEHELLRKVAVWTHWAFYVLMIVIPGGGLLARYGGIGAAQLLHDVGESVFFLLLWVHIGAALVHHFVFRTDVLMRMVRPAR